MRGAVDDVTTGGASFVTVMQAADFPKKVKRRDRLGGLSHEYESAA
jgi:hypothetical protein